MRFSKFQRSLLVIGLATVTCSSAFATSFAILFGGQPTRCGGVQGGNLVADVFNDPGSQGETFVKKHISNVKWEAMTIQCGFDNPEINKACATMSTGERVRKSGSVIIMADDRTMINQTFVDAILTDVTFPALSLDGGAKDPAYLVLKLAPTAVTREAADPSLLNGVPRKMWFPANFKLNIEGTDCRRVSKIDSFSIKQKVVQLPDGSNQLQNEMTDISFWIPREEASSLQTWFNLTMALHIEQPMPGELTYLDKTGVKMGKMQFSSLLISDFNGDLDRDGRPDLLVKVTCAVSGPFKWTAPESL